MHTNPALSPLLCTYVSALFVVVYTYCRFYALVNPSLVPNTLCKCPFPKDTFEPKSAESFKKSRKRQNFDHEHCDSVSECKIKRRISRGTERSKKEMFDGAIGRVCDIGDKADIWGYSSIHVRMLIIFGGLFFAHPVFWSCVRTAKPLTTLVATESLVLPRLLVLHCGSSTDIHALGRKPKTAKNKTEQNLV